MLIPPIPLLNFFVAVVMFSIGLRVTGGQLLGILRNRALVIRTLVANCILIPALGFLLVNIFPLAPDAGIGILLLAAIPGTPIALQFTRKATSRLAFGAAMIFALSLVSVAIAPLMIEVLPQIAKRSNRPILQLLSDIALYIGLPLCAGLWAVRLAPKVRSPAGDAAQHPGVNRVSGPDVRNPPHPQPGLRCNQRRRRDPGDDHSVGRIDDDRMVRWRPRSGIAPGDRDHHQHEERNRRALCGAVLFSRDQRLYGSGRVSLAHGAGEPDIHDRV